MREFNFNISQNALFAKAMMIFLIVDSSMSLFHLLHYFMLIKLSDNIAPAFSFFLACDLTRLPMVLCLQLQFPRVFKMFDLCS